MLYPPIGEGVILTGPFGEVYGYWTGNRFLQAVKGEDVELTGVTGWRKIPEDEIK